jgi:hypothetical protein
VRLDTDADHARRADAEADREYEREAIWLAGSILVAGAQPKIFLLFLQLKAPRPLPKTRAAVGVANDDESGL